MEGKFEGGGNEIRFKAWNAIGEGSISFNILLKECILIENSDSALIFDYGIRRFVFKYTDYVPQLKKLSMTVNLFKILPLTGTRGEIGISVQKKLSDIFDKNVNKK